jgi:hypothetical protein
MSECSILLDYAVSFTAVDPTSTASTAHLRNLGVVVKPPTTPADAVITQAIGDLVTPAVITLSGFFAEGVILDANFATDLDILGVLAPYTVLAAAPASTVAELWAAEISLITDISATAVGSTIEVRAADLATDVTITLLTVDDTGALPIPDQIVEVTDSEDLANYTENRDVIGAFDGGLTKVYLVIAADAASIPALILDKECMFFTVYGSTDYLVAEYETLFASWKGNKAVSTSVQSEGAALAIEQGWTVFFEDTSIPTEARAYYGIFSFGSLLSSNGWRNQQYIPIQPANGLPVDSLGLANSLFDDRLSFYLTDVEQGTRLSFFVNGGASITKNYVEEELKINMQSTMLQYLSGTQPFNLLVNRKQLEQVGQTIIDDYIDLGYLDPDGTNILIITESQEAFKVFGNLTTKTSEALWRVDIDASQSVGV